MSTIYDQVVASIKLGVAVPVPNHSFRYWDDPGTWSLPTGWTETNLGAVRYWTGYDDDDASVLLTGASIPADNTFQLPGTIKRIWPDNRAFFLNQPVYYSVATYLSSITTPGGTAGLKMQLAVDASESFSSPTTTTLLDVTSTEAAFTLHTGTATLSSTTSDKWARMYLIIRDAAFIGAYVDCVGVMFDPVNAAGYCELTNVFSTAAPPSQHYERFTTTHSTRLGGMVRYDPSGGAERLRLRLQLQNESLSTFQTLKQFYDLNHGTPGVPGVPLMVEPNLPGYPPTFMCNIDETAFPLDKQGVRGNRYGGTITFVGVWA